MCCTIPKTKVNGLYILAQKSNAIAFESSLNLNQNNKPFIHNVYKVANANIVNFCCHHTVSKHCRFYLCAQFSFRFFFFFFIFLLPSDCPLVALACSSIFAFNPAHDAARKQKTQQQKTKEPKKKNNLSYNNNKHSIKLSVFSQVKLKIVLH